VKARKVVVLDQRENVGSPETLRVCVAKEHAVCVICHVNFSCMVLSPLFIVMVTSLITELHALMPPDMRIAAVKVSTLFGLQPDLCYGVRCMLSACKYACLFTALRHGALLDCLNLSDEQVCHGGCSATCMAIQRPHGVKEIQDESDFTT
jgi:hypothetical protein